jgi:hypothetical protein
MAHREKEKVVEKREDTEERCLYKKSAKGYAAQIAFKAKTLGRCFNCFASDHRVA